MGEVQEGCIDVTFIHGSGIQVHCAAGACAAVLLCNSVKIRIATELATEQLDCRLPQTTTKLQGGKPSWHLKVDCD